MTPRRKTSRSLPGTVILLGFSLNAVLIAALWVHTAAAEVVPPPLLEYLFEEGAGNTVFNTGTFGGAHGTLRNGLFVGSGPTFSSDTPPGSASNFALAFDGINDFVRIPDGFNYTVNGSPASTPLDQLTVEAWIKPATLAGQRVIWDDYGNPGVLFAVFDGHAQFSISTSAHPGPGISLFVPGVLVTDRWQHFAGVYDGSQLRIFVDGEDTCRSVNTSGAIQDNSTVNPGAAPLAIGADGVTIPALNFQGLIDEVRIHPVALDRSQLAGAFFANVPTASCAAKAIQDLIAKVAALNLKKGISNSLEAKLNAALNAVDDTNQDNDVAAINVLEAFINEVDAQRGVHISDTDADMLIAAARQIITLLGG